MVKGGARSAWRLLARAPEVSGSGPVFPFGCVSRTASMGLYQAHPVHEGLGAELRRGTVPPKGGRSVTMLPHRARDVLHGRTVDRQQVVAGNEAAQVRRAGRVNAPDDDLPCEPCNPYARAWVYQALIGHAGY